MKKKIKIKKEGNNAISSNVSGPRDDQIKTEKDKYCMISLICEI